ncbi:MAG: chemotaxis protein CheB, partial [Terriglobus roseus]|nr:chemotaxis protein CheB [Terriglobus roseus]
MAEDVTGSDSSEESSPRNSDSSDGGQRETFDAPEHQNGHGVGVSAPPSDGRQEENVGAEDGLGPDDTALLNLSVEASGPEMKPPALPYPVVAVGASAGGLPAFRELLEALDPETGMSFVLVTHLSPAHKSFLTEIVDRYTKMPVGPAETGQRPEPNHLYILQPNQLLQVRKGVFQVEERSTNERIPLVIDTFMRSLATDQKNHAVGVVLSGSDGDGASGLKAIKAEGGIALVQSPETAVHPG